MSSGKSSSNKFSRFKVMYLSSLIAQIALEIINPIESSEDDLEEDEFEIEELPSSEEEGPYWYDGEGDFEDDELGFCFGFKESHDDVRRDERLEEISDLLGISYARAWEYAERVKSECQDEIILAELELARQLAKFSKFSK